jgi:ATP-dependent Zn protease
MDGVGGRDGVLLVGTTNNPAVIDPAILRSGRMDRLIEVRRPDRAALALILRYHLRDDLAECDLSVAAGLAVGGSGADCARWTRDARQAARHEKRPMQMEDLLHEIGGEPIDPAIEMRTAVHEAGHAVASCILQPGALVGAGIGNGTDIGASAVMRAPVRTTRAAILTELLELLAGRAAEEVLLGDVSGGCGGSLGSDLAQATVLAVALETALGLGTEGLVFLGLPTPSTVSTMLAHSPSLTAKVKTQLDAVYQEAVILISTHRDAVGAVARALIDMRALTGPEIAQIVADHPAPGCPA